MDLPISCSFRPKSNAGRRWSVKILTLAYCEATFLTRFKHTGSGREFSLGGFFGSIERGKVSMGIEVADAHASAPGMRLSD